ncbi:MAG: cytochrome-c peroxidase, partial [Bacteroidota bacterium]|nr:cytochrome-c peroxidase [Bacteroidota bacterium]
MKNIYLLISTSLLFLAFIFNVAFTPKDAELTSSIDHQIKEDYKKGLSDFEGVLIEFISKINNYEDESATPSVKDEFLKLRLSYKKIEFLCSYLDPEFVDDYINGPPLPGLERNAPSLNILDPEGLQVLEELVFSENPLEEKENILHYSELLQRNFSSFSQFQKTSQLTTRHIFEAVRMQLVRVFNLGITGFDSPVALNSLPEAAVSLDASYVAVKKYFPVIKGLGNDMAEEIDGKYVGAIKYLHEHNDFDSFDRLYFLKEYINPLYKIILQAHLALGIETIYEVAPSNQKFPVNYYAENLFDKNFLNPFYFTELQEEKYNQKVVDLGRMLFFDPVLSSNNQRSCASCHNPQKGFADGMVKSKAFDHLGTLSRNSPTLINSVYADRYFYDLRTDVLENQIEHVLVGKKEFHTSYIEIFNKLNLSEEYVHAFNEAFPEIKGKNAIMKHTMSAALSAYIISLSGFDSPFDKYVRNESKSLDTMAIKGFNLFMGKAGCGTCHFAPVFNGLVPPHYKETESEVLGVPASASKVNPEIDADLGRYKG